MYSRDYIGKTVKVIIDRPIGTESKYGTVYGLNYGYIPGTVSADGEELDAYILGYYKKCEEYTGKVIAVLHRVKDNDDKLIVAPQGKEYTDEQILALTEFMEMWHESVLWR